VLSVLKRITADTQQLNGDLPVSVDNMSFIADQFVSAADMLPTFEKLVCSCMLFLVIGDLFSE